MRPALFRALEFDRVCEALASLARTPLGRDRLAALQPRTEPAEVQGALELTGEAVGFVQEGGSLDLHAPADLLETLSRLEIADEPLDALALVGFAKFLLSLDTVIHSVER